MEVLFDRTDLPDHLFNIAELDFHEDLFASRFGSLWFRLGAWTIKSQRDGGGVEDVIERQSVMVPPECFSEIFEKLQSVGNVLGGLGEPGESLQYTGGQKEYRYSPFHQFSIRFTSISGEPLVFCHRQNPLLNLFVNPDLYLFLRLEEKVRGSGIWWDPRRGVEAMRHNKIDNGNLEIIDIRVDHLRRYLKARQLSLLVGHYRHLHLFDPQQEIIDKFVAEDTVAGSPDQGAKAIFENSGLRRDIPDALFLQRRLHLWFEIKPLEIDTNDPWADEPSFDTSEFLLPTGRGPVAPARWKPLRLHENRNFGGELGEFLDRIYFRQEVLSMYEGTSGFKVLDDGSVYCRSYWGLSHGVMRIGNELLSTNIGDFAEGVPFEEWPHWKQFAVEPPSRETINALCQEPTIPEAVNSFVNQLLDLNVAFSTFARKLGISLPEPLWKGSLTSLAGRQLKWNYPSAADDDEFLKRATLMSTFVIDGLVPGSIRKLLRVWEGNLHLNSRGQSLGPRKLLERVTLIATLIDALRPAKSEISLLVGRAEGPIKLDNSGLQRELYAHYQNTRSRMEPLAFLYELRTHGGLAHAPNEQKLAAAVINLGLPEGSWGRTDYLQLLGLVGNSISEVVERLSVTP